MSMAEGHRGRKRKTHAKSRAGCGNCKLRRVKCDETRPECKKCQSYNIACDYDDATTQMHHTGEDAFIIEPATQNDTAAVNVAPHIPLTPPSDDFSSWLNYPLALHETDEVYRITESDLDRFKRFQDRTVLTIGTSKTIYIHRDQIVRLSWGHSYLIHIVFAMVLMHDRYLSDKPWGQPSHAETFHHYHGTAIFNTMLSKPVQDEEKDALWGAAALLGAISFASLDATNPEESWPLAPPSPGDLDWLRMTNGKKEVWKLADPLRADSIWRPALAYNFENDPTPPSSRKLELDSLLPYLTRLYQYDEHANEAHGDPYFTATSTIVRLLAIQCTHSTILFFLAFVGRMDPEYKNLLHQKDPKAMLLLAWWYGMLLEYPAWWLQRRSLLECKAICIYLQRHYLQQTDIGRLLDYPKMKCGLAVSSEFAKQVDEARSNHSNQHSRVIIQPRSFYWR